MQIIYLIQNALKALVEFGPALAVNVFLGLLSSVFTVWTGYHLWQLAAPIGGRVSPIFDRTPEDVVLMAYVWGAFYSLLLMYLLGGAGVFTLPFLFAAMLLPPLLRGRKALVFPKELRNPGWKLLPFVILACGPLLISLTSPVPSWMDVLEGNVGPVQRLITFESFDRLMALPSALYPVNRATPLFTSFFGLKAQLFGLEGYEVLAASLVPTLLITMLAAYRLGKIVSPGHSNAGWLTAAAWVFTFHYFHLQGARSTVWQMTFALIAIAKVCEVYRMPGNSRLLFEAAMSGAAAILAHPFEGMFTVIAVILLAAGAWWSDSFRHTRNYVLALGIGIGAGAPLLWTWWPASNAMLVAGVLLIGSIPFVVRLASPVDSVSEMGQRRIPGAPLLFAIPALIAISAVLLTWDFYGIGVRPALLHELVRYPLPAGLTVALIILEMRRASVAALLAGSAILAATLPLWILPHLSLHPVTTASFRFEFPLKGMDFWLSGFLAVCGAVILTRLWSMPRRQWYGRAYVTAALILPMSVTVPLDQASDHSSSGLFGMARRQLHLVGEGYWRGWGYARTVVGPADREFFAKLRSLVESGQILETEQVAHVAEGSNLLASPFPAFTGIAQDMYLPQVDTANVHTFEGRLYDIDEIRPRNRWIVVEKSMLSRYPVNRSSIVYENKRLVLVRRHG